MTMTDEEGRKTKVEYDINGKQQKILLPSGVTLRRELSSTGLPVKLYRGDDDEVLAWLEYNSQGLVSSMTCDGGYRVEYEYGLNGELRQQVQRYFHPVSGKRQLSRRWLRWICLVCGRFQRYDWSLGEVQV